MICCPKEIYNDISIAALYEKGVLIILRDIKSERKGIEDGISKSK